MGAKKVTQKRWPLQWGDPWWSPHRCHSSDSCSKFSFKCLHPYQEKHTEVKKPYKIFDSSWFLNHFKASSWKTDANVEKVSFLFESSQKHSYPCLWEQDNTRFILWNSTSWRRLEEIPASVSGTIIQIPKQVKHGSFWTFAFSQNNQFMLLLKKNKKPTLQMSASVSKLPKWKKDGSSPWHVYIIVINSGTASHQLTIWYMK